jgi:hypothetical protein
MERPVNTILNQRLVIYPANVVLPMGDPLHYPGQCPTTGCMHCSGCGLGPQYTLTYRYRPGTTASSPAYEAGLCPRCASEAA